MMVKNRMCKSVGWGQLVSHETLDVEKNYSLQIITNGKCKLGEINREKERLTSYWNR